jgi:hypothetical protein
MPLGPPAPPPEGEGYYGDPADDYGPPGDDGGGVGSDPGFGAGVPVYPFMRNVAQSMDWGAQALKVAANAMKEKEEWQHVAELFDAVAAKWIVTRDELATALVALELRRAIPLTGARNNPEAALKNFITWANDLGLIDDQTTAA